jgi:fused signal recognition particle receptor
MPEALASLEAFLQNVDWAPVVLGVVAFGFLLLIGQAVRRMSRGNLHGELEDGGEPGPALGAGDEDADGAAEGEDADGDEGDGDGAAEREPAAPARPAPDAGRAAMHRGLAKTRQGFMAKLNGVLFGKGLDPSLVDELEELLVTSDIGIRTAERLLGDLRGELSRKEIEDAETVQARLRAKVLEIVRRPCPPLPSGHGPSVIMVIGVNGVGKTTTIGKLAARLVRDGKKVVLAAGDTFRAAAVEQLEVWAERAGAELVKGAPNGDPSAVIFDAIKHAEAIGADICIADTAGRLHTKVNLMEELKKVRRVANKAKDGAPHEVLLVLDATTGQNAISQAKQFTEMVQVSSLALTKLDGTAKGGVVVAIADALGLPVRLVGVGEGVDDLRDFDADAFVEALFADEDGARGR